MENKQQVPLLAHSLWGGAGEGASWFLIWGEGRGMTKDLGQSSGLGGLPTLWWWCVQRACAVPCFHSQHPTQFFRSGSWAFWSLCVLLSRICPTCVCTQLFLVPYSFFVFSCSGDVCPGSSTAAKDPSPRPV